MFGSDGVAAPDDHRVRFPGVAYLRLDLLLYPRQGNPFHAAEYGGLVLDAQQDEVLVGRPSGALRQEVDPYIKNGAIRANAP